MVNITKISLRIITKFFINFAYNIVRKMFSSNYRTKSSIIQIWEILKETMSWYNILSNLTILKFKGNHFTKDCIKDLILGWVWV